MGPRINLLSPAAEIEIRTSAASAQRSAKGADAIAALPSRSATPPFATECVAERPSPVVRSSFVAVTQLHRAVSPG